MPQQRTIDSVQPSGMVSFFANSSAPDGWLKCNGAAISRTTYSDLFAAIGTTYGIGDGSTTFNVPDLRGDFIRGWDDAKGVDSGRTIASRQGFAMQNITGTFETRSFRNRSSYDSGAFAYQQGLNADDGWDGSVNALHITNFDASRQVTTANETRPRSVALLACIKY